MTKPLPFLILSAGALVAGTAAIADARPVTTHATVAAKSTTTTTAKPSLMTRMKTAFARPAATSATTTTHTAATAAGGRMVTTKTSTGKTVTYNCSKAGNANKKACKS